MCIQHRDDPTAIDTTPVGQSTRIMVAAHNPSHCTPPKTSNRNCWRRTHCTLDQQRPRQLTDRNHIHPLQPDRYRDYVDDSVLSLSRSNDAPPLSYTTATSTTSPQPFINNQVSMTTVPCHHLVTYSWLHSNPTQLDSHSMHSHAMASRNIYEMKQNLPAQV